MAIGFQGSYPLYGTNGLSATIYYTENYNINSNTSTLTVSVSIASGDYAGVDAYLDNGISVDDIPLFTASSYDGTHGVWISTSNTLYTVSDKNTGATSWTSGPISHKDNGSGSVKIAVNFSVKTKGGTNLGSVSDTRYITLTTIPRASSLSLSATSIDVGGTITANISRHSPNFKHTVEFYIDNNYKETYTGVATSQSFKIPDSWYNAMPSSVSCTAYCRITTYNRSTQIGDQVRKSFTVKVPSNIIPSIGDIVLDPIDINNNDILVQGKNKINISVSGCSAGIGSGIKSYSFDGPGVSITTTNSSYTFGPVSSSGELTYTVTVTDNRGRSTSKQQNILCYSYATPTVSLLKAYRASYDGDGNVKEDVNGTYLMVEYNASYSDVNSTNSVIINVRYDSANNRIKIPVSDDTFPIDLNGDTDTTYNVFLTIEDNYGGKNQSSTSIVFGQSRILNISKDGTGVAIGKMSEYEKTFECRWDAKFHEDVECNNVNCTDISINKKTIFDLIYPIGSIYMSMNDIDPSNLFGGTWEQIKDRFLLAAGSSYAAGSTGGEATHKLTVSEMPAHSHNPMLGGTRLGGNNGSSSGWQMAAHSNWSQVGTYATTSSTGGGAAHNNMPPYLAVYMWRRTE